MLKGSSPPPGLDLAGDPEEAEEEEERQNEEESEGDWVGDEDFTTRKLIEGPGRDSSKFYSF